MPTELTKYTKGEQELVSELASGKNRSMEVLIPDDLDPKVVVQWSKAVSSLLDKTDSILSVYLQAAGRLLFVARKNPKVLEEARCGKIEDYIETILKCRNHRTTVYNYSSGYMTFPELTPAKAAEIGTVNLQIASKVAKGKSQKQKATILEKAAELPTAEFREYVEQHSGVSGPGATTTGSFMLMGSTEEIQELKEYLAGTKKRPIEFILEALSDKGADEELDVVQQVIAKSVQVGHEDDPDVEW